MFTVYVESNTFTTFEQFMFMLRATLIIRFCGTKTWKLPSKVNPAIEVSPSVNSLPCVPGSPSSLSCCFFHLAPCHQSKL